MPTYQELQNAVRVLRRLRLTRVRVNSERRILVAALRRALPLAKALPLRAKRQFPLFYRRTIARLLRETGGKDLARERVALAEEKTTRPAWATKPTNVDRRFVEGDNYNYKGYCAQYVSPSSVYPGLHNIVVDYQGDDKRFLNAQAAVVGADELK